MAYDSQGSEILNEYKGFVQADIVYFKTDGKQLEGINIRDKTRYNLNAPIEINVTSNWNKQIIPAI